MNDLAIMGVASLLSVAACQTLGAVDKAQQRTLVEQWEIVLTHQLGNPSYNTREPTYNDRTACMRRVDVLNHGPYSNWRYVCLKK